MSQYIVDTFTTASVFDAHLLISKLTSVDIYFTCNLVSVCVSVSVYVLLQLPSETRGTGDPGAGVKNVGELPDVSAQKQSMVLYIIVHILKC